jgi:prepilin-type N-terminal cleavage/methylation domain-containing protein
MRELGTRKTSSGLRAHSAGFSLIEVVLAIAVLAIGLLGGMVVFATAAASNGKSRLNTAGSELVESTMERVLAIPESALANAAQTSITDCGGNTFAINTTVGGSPLVPFSFPAQIDFNQAAVAGYSMLYSACSGTGSVPFDVRWNVAAGPTPNTQYVTVSARRIAGPGAALARPITLRTLRGDF